MAHSQPNKDSTWSAAMSQFLALVPTFPLVEKAMRNLQPFSKRTVPCLLSIAFSKTIHDSTGHDFRHPDTHPQYLANWIHPNPSSKECGPNSILRKEVEVVALPLW